MSLSYKHITALLHEYTRGTVYEFYIPEVEKPPYTYYELRSEPALSKEKSTQDTEIYEIAFCHKSVHEAVTMADGFRTFVNTYGGTEQGVVIKNAFHLNRHIPPQTGKKSQVVYKVFDSYQIRVVI